MGLEHFLPTTVHRISIPPDRRAIAISDIHGNLDFLQGLLEKIQFNPSDILFIVGDILEKGQRSLDTLRFLMQLSKTHTIHALRGNCDQITLDFMNGVGWPDEKMWHVLNYWRERGLLTQMAAESGFPLRGPQDFPALRRLVQEHFAPELNFLTQMPVVVETEHYIFVHGGIPREERLEDLEAHMLMKNDNFVGQNHIFQKWVVVGHWPVTLYDPVIQTAKPLVRADQHTVSIDGGNVLKVDGQLNALFLPADPGEGEGFSYAAYDGYPTMTALDDQTPSTNSLNIRWSDSVVEILEPHGEVTLCRHISTGRQMWILSDYLSTRYDGLLHCEDSTDYLLPVRAGDRLSIVRQTAYGTLAKRDGVTGWYLGRFIQEEASPSLNGE